MSTVRGCSRSKTRTSLPTGRRPDSAGIVTFALAPFSPTDLRPVYRRPVPAASVVTIDPNAPDLLTEIAYALPVSEMSDPLLIDEQRAARSLSRLAKKRSTQQAPLHQTNR